MAEFVGAVPVSGQNANLATQQLFDLAAVAANGSLTKILFRVPTVASRIRKFKRIAMNLGATAVTGSTSNYVTITIVNNTTSTTLATLTSNGTTNWSAYSEQLFTINVQGGMNPGDLITAVVANTGSGAALAAGQLELIVS